jgi:hypothetical protein
MPERTRSSLRLSKPDAGAGGLDAEGRRRSGRVQQRPSYVDVLPAAVNELLLARHRKASGRRASAPARISQEKGHASSTRLAVRKRKRVDSSSPEVSESSESESESGSESGSPAPASPPRKSRRRNSLAARASERKRPGPPPPPKPQGRATLASRRALLASHWQQGARSTRARRSFAGVSVFDLAESGPSLKLKNVTKAKAGKDQRRGRRRSKKQDSDDEGDAGMSSELSGVEGEGSDDEVAKAIAGSRIKKKLPGGLAGGALLPTPPSTSESENGLATRSRSATAFDDPMKSVPA